MRRAATFALAIAGVGAAVLYTAPDKAPRIGADGFPTDWKTTAGSPPPPVSATPRPDWP